MILWMWACAGTPAETVVMTGIVGDAPKNAGAPVEGATVLVLDGDLAEYGTATTAADGSFAVDVPAGLGFDLHVSGEGYLTTVFSGTAGLSDFDAGAGYPWIAPVAFADAVRAEFSACPTVAAEGAIATGEARQYLAEADDYNDLPLAASAAITAYGSDGAALLTCYLDDSGLSVADGTVTGATGRFAVFGIPQGAFIVETRWLVEESDDPFCQFRYTAAEGGLVPMYPALVPLDGC